MTLFVRSAVPQDAAAMTSLINEIIAIGGTTAFEDLFDRESVNQEFISGPNVISCAVAEKNIDLLGFQGLFWPTEEEPLPSGWASIATFARIGYTGSGVGRTLFVQTLLAAQAADVETIDATIRADNVAGLAFYDRLGFSDYDRLAGVPLNDGTPVDRIRKRLDL